MKSTISFSEAAFILREWQKVYSELQPSHRVSVFFESGCTVIYDCGKTTSYIGPEPNSNEEIIKVQIEECILNPLCGLENQEIISVHKISEGQSFIGACRSQPFFEKQTSV